MTRPAIIRKSELIRMAEAARETGCRIEIKVGGATITIYPGDAERKLDGIDYGRPVM